jgi:hypothetical protein
MSVARIELVVRDDERVVRLSGLWTLATTSHDAASLVRGTEGRVAAARQPAGIASPSKRSTAPAPCCSGAPGAGSLPGSNLLIQARTPARIRTHREPPIMSRARVHAPISPLHGVIVVGSGNHRHWPPCDADFLGPDRPVRTQPGACDLRFPGGPAEAARYRPTFTRAACARCRSQPWSDSSSVWCCPTFRRCSSSSSVPTSSSSTSLASASCVNSVRCWWRSSLPVVPDRQ